VNAHRKAPFRRRRLGKRLRALREQAGLSLDEASRRLEKSRTSLFRIESGENKADVHLLRSLMDIYDIYDPELLDRARDALKPSPFEAFRVTDLGYVDAEVEASRVCEYPGLNLPGLLQTEPYMRALFGRARRRMSSKQLENDVTVRLMRQERLTSEESPLELVAITDEAALRREVGGSEVMFAQLQHLKEAAALPAVTLQVLPLKEGAHSAMNGAFILLDLREDDQLLYHEYVTGALHIDDAEEVREAKLVFEMLRSEALSPADSVELIGQLATLLYLPS
jgi:transcriptional regulator with XRE-family HTH domain